MYDTMKPEKRNLTIEQILRVEWEMFRRVDNIGGRAGCQEQWPTFHIMRYAYYDAWSNPMLLSYQKDLAEAAAEDRNLVMEKYAYMMAYTDPEYYAGKLAPHLPEMDGEKAALIDEIAKYMVDCDREFASKYPKFSAKGRPVEAAEDSSASTSTETYARGELRTYSKITLRYFIDHIRTLQSENANFAMLVKEKMARMYGYASLEDAERKL